jgi:hypothetical protein
VPVCEISLRGQKPEIVLAIPSYTREQKGYLHFYFGPEVAEKGGGFIQFVFGVGINLI